MSVLHKFLLFTFLMDRTYHKEIKRQGTYGAVHE